MKRTVSLMIVGIATAATVALSGCSGSTSGEAPAPPPAQTQAATPDSSTTPSTEASASAEASPSQPTESPEGDSAGKPPKEDIVQGLTKFYVKNQSISEDKANKFAVCMVDELYDKADATTLEAMRDGDPTKINQDDAGLFGTAGVTCAPKLQ